jgi:xanthine dehydrogenase accessory factor
LSSNFPFVLIRGGGDLATGVAARLHRSGFGVIVTEIEKPRVVRRLVSLAEAVFIEAIEIEDLSGRLVSKTAEALESLDEGRIPVVIDPDCSCRFELTPSAMVDARMLKMEPELGMDVAPIVIGLGPGFTASVNCHAVVETKRGHNLGRVIWEGEAEENTGIPEPVAGFDVDRVLRAPANGRVNGLIELGSLVMAGEMIAQVNDENVIAPFDGALRGLIHGSVEVKEGEKIGDLDPRGEIRHCFEISDKALAIGGGVLEALLSRSDIRGMLGS